LILSATNVYLPAVEARKIVRLICETRVIKFPVAESIS
jgi:hypothetical protein